MSGQFRRGFGGNKDIVVASLARTGVFGEGTSVVQGQSNWEIGALYVVRGGAAGNSLYANIGQGASTTSASWVPIDIVSVIPVFPKNLLDGGDMTVNPWQRNIAGLATANVITSAISNTVTYFPDRFFAVGGASSSILLAKVTDTNVVGFNNSVQMTRSSGNADVAVLNFGQVLETADCYRLQSQTVTLSFWARTAANYSGGALTVKLFTGTGSNDTAANMIAGSWAGSATPISTTQTLTSTMTRYTFTSTVLGATISQVGILLTWTPSGTAGTTDGIVMNGFQLEEGPQATTFEHRDAELELGLCQRYCAVFAEPASGVVISGSGMITTSNTEQVTIPLPTTMYKAPTVTVAAGGLKFNIAGVVTAVGAGFAAGTTHTPTMITVVGAVTATSGQATALQGGAVASGGYVLASADF